REGRRHSPIPTVRCRARADARAEARPPPARLSTAASQAQGADSEGSPVGGEPEGQLRASDVDGEPEPWPADEFTRVRDFVPVGKCEPISDQARRGCGNGQAGRADVGPDQVRPADFAYRRRRRDPRRSLLDDARVWFDSRRTAASAAPASPGPKE